MVDSHPRPDLTEAKYALIQRFCLLSDDQRSYKSVLTLSDFVGIVFIRLFLVRSLELWILPLFLCLPFNYSYVISADRSMSQFSSNLPLPPRSRFCCIPGAAPGGQPLIPSSSPVVVPAPTLVMNSSSDGAGSFVPVSSHGHVFNEDVTLPSEPFEPMDKGKQPIEEGFQHKRKWAISVERDESVLGEGLMADARRAGREEESFRINSSPDSTGRLADVADNCRQLPLHLHHPVQWLNECLGKADYKELRQHDQRLPSLCDTIVCFY